MDNNEQEIFNALSQAYDLSKLSYFKEPEKGISTKNIIVSTADELTYFIKRHKKAELDKIKNAEKAAIFVSENSDVPVVLPLKNKAGEFHQNIDGQIYSVFPNLPDTQYRPDSKKTIIPFAYGLGEMLGQIHSASQKNPIPKSITPVPAWTMKSREESLREFEEMKKFISKKDSLDAYDKRALMFIKTKTTLLEEGIFTEKSKQPLVVCHGDYHKANLLFDERGKITGICDWDVCGAGNPYTDYIRALKMCVIKRDYDKLEDKKEEIRAFTSGYASSCGFRLDIIEISCALNNWIEKLLISVWPLTDHYYLGHTKTDSSLETELKKVSFLRDKKTEFLR
ncbi:MAG: phosphotransferase, partial [Candidatus Moraniibacteriota bacterium]